jgi:CRISPR system Cascade subunit CasB
MKGGNVMKGQKDHPFVSSLEGLRDAKDRAALGRLRRGLGKKMGTPEMFPYVVPYLPDSVRERGLFFLVASLFALHPQKSPRGTSLGNVFKRIWEGSESIEKRFTNLLSADFDDIGGHLRQAVSLAKSRDVPIDYHQLLHDLKYWDHPDRFIQFAWAHDFWGREKEDVNENLGEGGIA